MEGLGRASGRLSPLKGPFLSRGTSSKASQTRAMWTCPFLVIGIHAALVTSCVFLPAYREEEAWPRAGNMLCHFLPGSIMKMSVIICPAVFRPGAAAALWGCGHPFTPPALCSFPRLQTSLSIVIPLICIPMMPSYFFILVFLFCLMAGGSHLDRTQTIAMSPSA